MYRKPEPELMLDIDQVKAYAEADFSLTDESFLIRIDQYLSSSYKLPNHNFVIIDLGCGPGNISELIAKKWPKSKVIGIDGSKPMLQIALDRRNSCKNLDNLVYVHSCLSNPSSYKYISNLKADLAISNSFLHHLHHPISFWKNLKASMPKGSLTIHRDLKRPISYEKATLLRDIYLPESPDILNNDYISSLCAAFTLNELKDQFIFSGLKRFEVFEVNERYLEVVGSF